MTAEKDFSRLFQMHQGIFHTRLLHEGICMAVFDHLTRPADPADLAVKLGTHPENTLFFLRGLTAAGLAERDESGNFWNSPLSQNYLVRGTPSYLGDYLAAHAAWNRPFFEEMGSIIKNGPPARQAQADDEEIWAREALSMVNYQRTITGPILARTLCRIPGFSRFSRLLDLGGGPGLNAMAVVQTHPCMTGTIFDRPAVVRVAEEEIRKAGMADRVKVETGDFTRDPMGQGYDLVLATACLNFAREDLTAMMAKIFDALNPGGIFVSVHDGLTRGRTDPAAIALSWLPVSMMWQELGLDRGQIARACTRAGFKTVRSRPIAWGMGTMELDIATKETP